MLARFGRLSVPRGLIAGTLVDTALVWGPYAVIPGSSLLSALAQSGVYLGLLTLTICSRRAKVLLIRTIQRFHLQLGRLAGPGMAGSPARATWARPR